MDQQDVAPANWEEQFLDLANWALYGETHPIEYSSSDVQSLCAKAAAHALRPSLARNVAVATTHYKDSQ